MGLFSDYLTNTFAAIELGPPSPGDPNGGPTDSITLTQTFNGVDQGFGQFALNPGLSPGMSTSGELLFTYDLYNVSPGNPTFDPGTDSVSFDNFMAAPASITVPAAVPEPGSMLLLAAGLGLVAYRVRRLRRG